MKIYPLLRLSAITVLTVITAVSAHGQNYRFEAGVRLGGANYLGEFGGKFLPRRDFVADMKLKATAGTMGAYMRYAVLPRVSMGMGFQWGRIRGADSLSTNPDRVARNLSFRNDIMEVNASLEFEFFEHYNVGGNRMYRVDFTAYGFVGLAYYKHNPEAFFEGQVNVDDIDHTNGTTNVTYEYSGYHKLQPLQTEGVNYSLSGLAFITGGGFYFTFRRVYRIGMRLGVRTTQTDYLDDASTTYRDNSSFEYNEEGVLSEQEALAMKLSYRGDELSDDLSSPWVNQRYPEGRDRGNPDKDDSYVFGTIEFAYVIKGKGGKYKRQFHNGYIRRKGRRVSISRFFNF